MERTAAEEQRKAEASRKVQEAASETYRIAIEAALEAGARLGAAQILAAEALDRAMDETLGAGVSEEAQLAARERVVKAVRLMAEGADGEAAAARSRKQVDGVVDPESLHDRSLDSEVIFDKGRRRERRNLVATGAAKDEVTIAFYPGGRGPRLIPSPHTNPDAPIADVSVVSVLSPSGSGQSIPPPMCPLRLVDLMEEALHVAADTPSSEEKMWDPTVAALSDGAAAAAERARSRTQGSMGRMLTAAAEGWGTPSLPNWLGLSARARTGPGPGLGIERDGRHERALARRDLAKRALGSGFEAVAAVRAHDVQWPGRGGDNASGNMGQGGEQGQRQRQSKIGPGSGTLPVQFTGFTWDGVTVVMKEVVPGCARVAQPVTPNFVDVQKMKDLQSWESTWVGYYGDRGSVPEEEEQNGSGVDDVDVDSGGKRPCLVVEAMVVPSKDIVVDIIVPVSKQDTHRNEHGPQSVALWLPLSLCAYLPLALRGRLLSSGQCYLRFVIRYISLFCSTGGLVKLGIRIRASPSGIQLLIVPSVSSVCDVPHPHSRIRMYVPGCLLKISAMGLAPGAVILRDPFVKV